MMKVVIELDENYSNILTITAVGCSPLTTRVSTESVNLAEHNYLKLGSDGKWINGRMAEEGK